MSIIDEEHPHFKINCFDELFKWSIEHGYVYRLTSSIVTDRSDVYGIRPQKFGSIDIGGADWYSVYTISFYRMSDIHEKPLKFDPIVNEEKCIGLSSSVEEHKSVFRR